ncbi:MAG TPA: hypothetical protein VHK88_13290 [Aquihabitans sp.]|jgi:hypothetical protein|nr:hypothetical protein [Aquihabitans sp.]
MSDPKVTPAHITPVPSDQEVAAIVAAVEVAWPRAAAPAAADPTPRWRWSGRWWSKPIPQRRNRPW